jgi:hypothetical protein
LAPGAIHRYQGFSGCDCLVSRMKLIAFRQYRWRSHSPSRVDRAARVMVVLLGSRLGDRGARAGAPLPASRPVHLERDEYQPADPHSAHRPLRRLRGRAHRPLGGDAVRSCPARSDPRAGQSGRALARSAPVHNAVSLSRSAGIGIVRCVEATGRARTATRRAGLRRCAVDRQIHPQTTWRSAGQTLSPLF